MSLAVFLHTFTSILVLALIILLVVGLRRLGKLRQEHGVLFAWLVTHVTLPALIFSALSHSTLEWKYLLLFLIMFGVELCLLLIAWLVGRFLQLEAPKMGAFLLVSAFGSSALLGYALIVVLFPHDAAALSEGVFVSELGVGLPLFTVGVMVAMHYGRSSGDTQHLWSNAALFFRSPIFVAILLGLLWSFSPLGTRGPVITPLFDAVDIVAHANTFLVTLTVGVLLSFSSLRPILGIALATMLLKLLLSPAIVFLPASLMGLESWQMQVLLLEAAMPSAMLSVVLSKQYGCDAELAAQLVFITLVGSLFTTALMIDL